MKIQLIETIRGFEILEDGDTARCIARKSGDTQADTLARAKAEFKQWVATRLKIKAAVTSPTIEEVDI